MKQIQDVLNEIYALLATCTNDTVKYEVQEDLDYLQKYIPNPSISFLQGLRDRLKKHQ
jgi:hypothetical protein